MGDDHTLARTCCLPHSLSVTCAHKALTGLLGDHLLSIGRLLHGIGILYLATSESVMPRNVDVVSLISPNITANPDEPGTFGIPCSLLPDLPPSSTSSSSELSVGPFADKPDVCQTLINVSEGYNLIGLSLLKHYYSARDINGTTIGFAPSGF
ncbi:hypothetical protein B0H16DRAFT_1739461 [Mycena metata]|uniref:Peptidase A1 domain-containing protein n=1 Tax=Mycena metata TaxID=1033252 RepID=A0AAD7HFP9_9AGAR|nr:hypothetical protein B0H16DRAFT_1739461 [Mycena metata]